MKIYAVIWEDRHAEATAHLFSDKEKAISWARGKAKKYCTYAEDFDEQEVEGWIYNVKYSCEDDSLRVVELILDGEIK